MTQDEIIEIAQECRLIGIRPYLDGIYIESLAAFAKLVAEKEREACAKISDDADGYSRFVNQFISKRIRARGEQA